MSRAARTLLEELPTKDCYLVVIQFYRRQEGGRRGESNLELEPNVSSDDVLKDYTRQGVGFALLF